MKIVFFGSSKYIIPTVKMLQDNFDLALIVTTERNPEDAVPSFARENNIPYLAINSFKDEGVLDRIKNIGADAGVLGYFGRILPQELLSFFPKGIINIHPSLLPKYRGPTPVQTAILNGDKLTGTTIILLDNEVDRGPMLTQQKEEILPNDTTDSLHEKLFILGAQLIKDILPRYLTGTLDPLEQNHNDATYTNHLSKSDGQIDINNPPDKEKLDRMIRAYFPWPGVWGKWQMANGKWKILKFLPYSVCHPNTPVILGRKNDDSRISKECDPGHGQDDQMPQNDKGFCIQVEGGNPMSMKDFINGYPEIGEKIKDLLS